MSSLTCFDFSCKGTFACAGDTCELLYMQQCGGEGGSSDKGYFFCDKGSCNMNYFCDIEVNTGYCKTFCYEL